jgi:hypothetical protein
MAFCNGRLWIHRDVQIDANHASDAPRSHLMTAGDAIDATATAANSSTFPTAASVRTREALRMMPHADRAIAAATSTENQSVYLRKTAWPRTYLSRQFSSSGKGGHQARENQVD